MNGAESLARTLLNGGVDVCFANPGTSEMHFVGALDRVEGIRCVLELFEGVATGAADGYARMADRPAATLLHLGPGLANGLANLHNAQRARTPMVNIVGDHATYHRQYDAPLTSDVMGTARPYSHWLRTSKSAAEVAGDAADAIVAARTAPGGISTLILPANTAWDDCPGPVAVPRAPAAPPVDPRRLERAAQLCRAGSRTGLILGGPALRGHGMATAGRIAAKMGVRLLSSYSVARLERGAHRVMVEPIPYPIDAALAFLRQFDSLILFGGAAPVAFFAYPGKPSVLTAEGCNILAAAEPHEDVVGALETLADLLAARMHSPIEARFNPDGLASGAISPAALGRSIAALLPEDSILVDESVTSGAAILQATAHAQRHDLLKNVGGSIGFALPAAVGAAIACPDRKVVCLQGDGSAMYTLQALWSQVRENLNVTNVILANRRYAVLQKELENVRAGTPGPRALSMLDIGNPTLDWCLLARGMGMEATRVADMAGFNEAWSASLESSAPRLIEVVM
jgi:acetolactate synthase I/II/III large subunit